MNAVDYQNNIYNIFGFFPRITFSGCIEIAILSYFIYKIAMWLKNTRSFNLLKGIGIILCFVLIAVVFNFTVILWMFEQVAGIAIITLVIIFQNELRQAIERIGRHKFVKDLFPDKFDNKKIYEKQIEEITKAVFDMAKVKTGALIVIAQDEDLTQFIKTGIIINGEISSQLLINIFEKNTPLHDGAVIITDNVIKSATCYLPLSNNPTISKELGTRHRAAIGVSEITDALIIVVSEETGQVSLVMSGRIIHIDDKNDLKNKLTKIMIKENQEDNEVMNIEVIKKIREYVNGKKNI